MPETVAEAIAAAQAEQARYLDVQHRALHAEPDERPTPAEVIAASQGAELAQQRVEIARRREEAAKEQGRREACADLGGRIDAFYDQVSQSATGTVLAQQLAEAVARLRQWAADHDAQVEALRAEAAGLGARQEGGQLRPEHAFVAVAGDGVRHEHRLVAKVGSRGIDYAVQHAVRGDVDAAARELGIAKDCTPPVPDYYLKDVVRNGVGVQAVYGSPRPDIRDMVRSGRLVRMTPAEVEAWQAGRQ